MEAIGPTIGAEPVVGKVAFSYEPENIKLLLSLADLTEEAIKAAPEKMRKHRRKTVKGRNERPQAL